MKEYKYRINEKYSNSVVVLPYVGKSFSEEEKVDIRSLLLTLNANICIENSGFLVIFNDDKNIECFTTEIESVLPKQALKRDIENDRKNKEHHDRRKVIESKRNDNFNENETALNWIHNLFGTEFTNDYNKNALLNYIVGKEDSFNGLPNHKWMDGLEKIDAVTETSDGHKISYEKIKSVYQDQIQT